MFKNLLILWVLCGAFFAHGGTEGHAGGGVLKNGLYMTFYSAGVYVNSVEESASPAFDLITAVINNMGLSGGSEKEILSAMLPNANRHFYKVLEEKFDAATLERLKMEYARITKIPSTQNLVLFAITDIPSRTTYLLPDYYKLSVDDQAAILFHEGYWLLNSKADYTDVVSAEGAFQDYLEKWRNGGYAPLLARKLSAVLRNHNITMKSGLNDDFNKKVFPNDRIELAGLGFTPGNCFGNIDLSKKENGIIERQTFIKCFVDIESHYAQWLQKYPRSNFFKEVGFAFYGGKIKNLVVLIQRKAKQHEVYLPNAANEARAELFGELQKASITRKMDVVSSNANGVYMIGAYFNLGFDEDMKDITE